MVLMTVPIFFRAHVTKWFEFLFRYVRVYVNFTARYTVRSGETRGEVPSPRVTKCRPISSSGKLSCLASNFFDRKFILPPLLFLSLIRDFFMSCP